MIYLVCPLCILLTKTMIIDLTEIVKKELSNFPQIANNNPTTNASLSKLFIKYSEDISNSLAKIRKILVDDRDNFFSNASYSYQAFTDRQREELTQLIRNNLAEVMNQINELKMFNDSDKSHKSQTQKDELLRLKQHQKGIIDCLYRLEKDTISKFKQFQIFMAKKKRKIQDIITIDKQAQKSRFKVPSAPPSNPFPNQPLEKQASLLYVEKVRQQTQLKQTNKQLQSINQLMANMSNIVLEQQLQTSSLIQIGEVGLFHIQKGNKNLVQANIQAKQTGRWFVLLFYSMALSLLVLDFLKS